ncbi:MAG TPA: RepB family plasmid replication initiator protein [Campylobacterales bacterium]|nr:RepB family plasmid replication initiator protein [Campylobacterales bacterium]
MESKKELVIKSNSLIDMQTDLSLMQLKVFTKIIMCTVKNPHAEFYRFSMKELLKDFHIESKHHTALKKATAGMIKAVILKKQNGEVQLPLFTKVVYDSGVVDMYLHSDLKPYILDIKERYTKYFFQSITGLNSMYSMRIYELLKQYEFRSSRSFELEELRFLLNITKGKYSKYTDFKKRVLLSSQKELLEKTDISFSFEEIRERRKVVRLDFKIISQHRQEPSTSKTV